MYNGRMDSVKHVNHFNQRMVVHFKSEALMCTPRILAGASLEAGITSLMRKIPEACSWRLIVFIGNYAASRREGLPQTLTPSLMIIEMVAIGLGPGLPLVSLIRMMRTIITSGGVSVHLAKVRAMMLWAGLLTKSLNHRLWVELKGESFLDGSLSQHSPCIMVEQTLWNMLATSTRKWPSTPRMKPWCLKCFHPVWGLQQWNGLTVWKKVLLIPSRSLLGPWGLVL